MKRPTNRIRAWLGTALATLTVLMAYLATNDIAPAVTFPAFIILALCVLVNGMYHASDD